MTRERQYGEDTPFEAWTRRQRELRSQEPSRISVIDHDRTFHQYRAHTDCVGERAIDNIMIVETKVLQTHGSNVMTLARWAARDTLTLLQAFIGVGKRNRATGSRVLTKRVKLGHETRNIRFWGIHVVSFSDWAPDTSEVIWWNRRPIREPQLVELLGFRRHPYTFVLRDERRHHAAMSRPLFEVHT